MEMSLAHAFLGSEVKDAIITDVMMVGAEFTRQEGLCSNDRSALSRFLRILDAFKIPTADKLQPFKKIDNYTAALPPIDLVNNQIEFGGRDFFLENGNPEAIILSSIPMGSHFDEEDIGHFQNPVLVREREMLRTAFAKSDYHHAEDDWYNWRQKMTELQPKFIMILGSDSFDPNLFMGDDYVCVTGMMLGEGLLISKKYLNDIGAYLLINDSLLLPCASNNNSHYKLSPKPLDLGCLSSASNSPSDQQHPLLQLKAC